MRAPRAYYNEIDPYAAQWLRNLISAGHIAPGDVDERDIRDVRPNDLSGYTQCHFFAGIGVWSYAARLAGVADDTPLWTGSCPCQPFSAAGRRGGTSDERHLWPHWFHLISVCRPPVVFGEQVASKDGLGWLDTVHADLEGTGYAVGAADLCAAGVGAPHIRQRLWFVADAGDERREGRQPVQGPGARREHAGAGAVGGVADDGSQGRRQVGADAGGGGEGSGPEGLGQRPVYGGPVNGFWRDADWLLCRDGKARPAKSGIFPLAHGTAGRVAVVRPGKQAGAEVESEDVRWVSRVGTLRGAGNAIVAPVAAEFIAAWRSARNMTEDAA